MRSLYFTMMYFFPMAFLAGNMPHVTANQAVYIPHIAISDGWETWITIDNQGLESSLASLSLYQQGELLHTEQITIEAQSRHMVELKEGFWGKLEYSNDKLFVRELFQHKTEHGVAEFQLDDQSARELNFLLPQYLADELSWAGITLLNHSAEKTASIQLTAIDETGRSIATSLIQIEPMSREVGLVSDFFDQLDFRTVARIHASSDQSLSGIIISGQGNSSLLFTKAVTSLSGGALVIPHIADDLSTWENLLVFDNLGSTKKSILIIIFSQGNSVFEEVIEVPVGQMVLNLSNYSHLNPDFGLIENTSEYLAVRQCFQSKNQDGIAEFLLDVQRSSSLLFTLPSTLPGDFNWKGVALSNSSSTAGTVTLQAYSNSEFLAETSLFLDANSREAILSSDLFPDLEMGSIANITAKSSFEMSGINISGKNHDRLLFTKAIECDDIKLLNTLDLSPKCSPDGDGIGRPDVIAIGDTLYLAYGVLTERNFHLLKLKADENLTLVENPIELFSGNHNFAVDIRVSKANGNLWYAFEDNKWNAAVDDTHFLNAAWYSSDLTLMGQQTDIASGITTTIPEAFSISPGDVPPNPEATDDPTPLWHNHSYYIFTRAWSGWIDEFTPNSKHHIRVFNERFEQTDDFILNFSTIIPGKTLSQNTLIDIDGQVFLIGGFYNARDDISGGSSVSMIPLSEDLKSTVNEKIPLLVNPGKWFYKVTAAEVYKGNLYINYQEILLGDSIQNIAVFDLNNNYELITTLEVSRFRLEDREITANHTTFEILNDKLYVFYPETNKRIFVKIFSL